MGMGWELDVDGGCAGGVGGAAPELLALVGASFYGASEHWFAALGTFWGACFGGFFSSGFETGLG